MSDSVKHTIVRFAIVFFTITVLFGLVLWQIVRIQTVQRDKWEKVAQKQVQRDRVIYAQRGNIYDDQNRLLASSIPQYVLRMDTRVEALHLGGDTLFYQYVDSIAMGLSRILGDKTVPEYKAKMVQAFRGRTRKQRDIRLYPGCISYTQKCAIEQLPLVRRGYYKSGFYYEEQHRRVKPFGSLASRTIGNIYGEEGHGNSGLEMQFDKQLSGRDGVSTLQRIAGHWQPVPVKEAESGFDVYTCLDANMMDICEDELRKRLTYLDGQWGCVILMEVATGDIKAISNLDRDGDGLYSERMNHAVTRVEPGSTFKTIALMAAIDDGRVNITDSVRVWARGWRYHGVLHIDSHPRDAIYSVRNAMAVSSNVALAQLIVNAYHGSAKKFVHKLSRMGLKDSIDYLIPGAQQARIDIPNDTVTISKMAYGYSVEMSPMQSLTFYNAIANNGHMIAPRLVRGIGKKGSITQHYDKETIKRNICSPTTLIDIRACLHDVVWDNTYGTASISPWGNRKAQSDIVTIAGKTGTAQIFEQGHYSKTQHRISFVGYFPEDNPQYTAICVIQAPKRAFDSGMDCGTVVKRIAERIMAFESEYIIQDGQLVFQMTNDHIYDTP